MISYFTQLLAASGVRIAGNSAPPPSDPISPLPPPEIVELAAETYVEASLPESHSVEQIAFETPVSTRPPRSEHTPQPPAKPLHIATADLTETAPVSSHEADLTVAVPVQTIAPAPEVSPKSSASPEEILRAVMKWVAASETPIAGANAAPATPLVTARPPRASPSPAVPPLVRPELRPPERVIMKAEAAPVIPPAPPPVEAPRAPAFAPLAVEAPRAPASAPLAVKAPRAPASAPPSVTIGAIHLRVEAPAAPPPIPPSPNPPTPARTLPVRSDGWLKLRRYGVLPH